MLVSTLATLALGQGTVTSQLQVDVLQGETILERAAVLDYTLVRSGNNLIQKGLMRLDGGNSILTETTYVASTGAFVRATRVATEKQKRQTATATATKGGREVVFVVNNKTTKAVAMQTLGDPSVAWFGGRYPKVGTKVKVLLPDVSGAALGAETVEYKGLQTIDTFVGKRQAHHVQRISAGLTQNTFFESSGRMVRLELLSPGRTITAALMK